MFKMQLLRIVIILAIFQVITADRKYELLTTEDHHVVTCVNTIIQRYFTPRRPLLISLPRTEYVTKSTLRTILPNSDSTFMVDILLESIHTESQWSIYESRLKSHQEAAHAEEYNYIILTWESRGDRNITGALSYQLQDLHRARPLNSKALFLIVICSSASQPPEVLALRVFKDMWAKYNVIDVVVLIPYVNTTKSYTNTLHDDQLEINSKAFYLYTWYPYSSEGNCANVSSVKLIDKWLVKNRGEFIYNANLFPNKISGNFMGCTVKVATRVLPPIVVELPDSSKKKYDGLELNFLESILEKLNLSAEFKVLLPTNKSSIEYKIDLISETAHGEADISIGGLVISEEFKSLADFTVSFLETAMKWYVPCAKYAHRWEAVFKVFSLGGWASFCCVGFLAAIMMRLIATHVNNRQVRESYNYMTLQSCLYIVWAIFVGVGVSHLPRTSTLRLFFSIVLCYSIALTVIFQTYFTSVLVNPRFEMQINSVKDILDLGIGFGYSSDIDGCLEGTDEFEYRIIKEHRVICRNQYECFNRVMKYRNFASIANTFYVARLMNSKVSRGTKREVCTVSNDIVRLRSVMYLKKGHPLLYRINKIIKWMTEGGLDIKVDNDLYLENKHKAVLPLNYDNDTWDYNNDVGDSNFESGYFVFSVMHLEGAFHLLFLGCILSCVVLVGEIVYHM